MAGRIDEAAHGAAVARIGEIGEHREALRGHLRRVLASSEFRGSRRSQMFLSQVVEHALNGEFDSLKERILGISIFGRSASYDTSEDAIVRVTASDVRRRLKQYYSVTPAEALRIELPAGSYIPEFHIDEDMLRETAALQEESKTPLVSQPTPMAAIKATVPPTEIVSGPAPPPAAPPRSTGAIVWVASAVALLAIGATAGRLMQQRTVPAVAGATQTADIAFYKDLLGPLASDAGKRTDIVLSNPHVLLYKGSQQPLPIEGEYYSRKVISVPANLANDLNEDANDAEAAYPHHYLAVKTTSYTGAGDAETAFALRGLFDSLGRPSHLTEARFLNWDAARDHHVVFLGAPYMNAWTKKNLAGENFSIGHEAIVNAHPQNGEPAEYRTTFQKEVMTDYGILWMTEYPNGSRILVVNGLNSAGSAGVGAFFTNPALMKPVYEKLRAANHGTMPANWQVIVQVDARENVPLREQFVALRVSPASSAAK